MSFMATKVKKAQTKVLANDIRTKAVKIIKMIKLGQGN